MKDFLTKKELEKRLDDADEKVAYNAEKGDYVVKVYDASGSELSDYLQKHSA